MTVQDLILHFSNHAYTYGEKIINAAVVIDGDRSEFKIDDIIYNEDENKFHLRIEEEG